jgi:hypothetical protein
LISYFLCVVFLNFCLCSRKHTQQYWSWKSWELNHGLSVEIILVLFVQLGVV